MDIKKFNLAFSDLPKYRLGQAQKAVFRDFISDWGQATVFSKPLRDELKNNLDLNINGKITGLEEEDKKSLKAVIILKDKLKIESVLIKNIDGRNTICISCQVGCPLGCLFCATGRMGFKRNLKAAEIIDQLLFWGRYLKSKQEKIDNIVFMGMGEPFLNYDQVINAIHILNDKSLFDIGARRISISTIGIPNYINKLAKEKLQVNLAISLHATDDKERSKIMPIASKYKINDILKAVDDYLEKTNRRVMIEYLMLDNFNDNLSKADKLGQLLKGKLCIVNLLTYNQVKGFDPSPYSKMLAFQNRLKQLGITTTIRKSAGRNVNAACGQLASKLFKSLPY